MIGKSALYGDPMLTGWDYTKKERHRHLSGEHAYATASFD